jgi:DNA uptake protein ComE-like DNA-binding protein
VLIVAMWIVLALAGLVLVFARAMRIELIAAANHVAGLQSENVARAALQFVLSQVDGTDGTFEPDTEVSYEAVQVGNGFFWILNPALGDDGGYYFGIRDEASRINPNTATTDMLVKLPGMTAELAAAVVDWRDADNVVSPGGAESEYYLLLPDPYYCKDSPFETVEELLLVKDASTQILFGEDPNLNGVLDSNENDASETEPPDNSDGHLDHGVFNYLTVHSVERNTSVSGGRRLNVNDVNTDELSALLRRVVVTDKYFRVMNRVRQGRPFRNVLDFYFRTALNTSEFAQVADQITTRREGNLVGLVNINTAPRDVLLCLPGLEESDVDALLAKRAEPDTDLANIAWVTEVLPEAKAVAVGDYITARSFQFSADILAATADGRAFRRYRALVDARTRPPRVLSWKDLTHLGWPLEPELLESIRGGEGPVKSLTVSTSGAP